MCSNHRKNHGCGQKKPKSTSSAIAGVETAANSSGVPTEFATEPTKQIWTFVLTLTPNFFRLNWTFRLPQKDNWVFIWTFFPLTNLFVTFVVFACFATTRVTMRLRAKNTGFSTGLYPVYAISYWWPCGADGRTDGRTDVRTDVHVTITSLPKFLGLIGYQICLAMVLRWRTSGRAPLSVKAYKVRSKVFPLSPQIIEIVTSRDVRIPSWFPSNCYTIVSKTARQNWHKSNPSQQRNVVVKSRLSGLYSVIQ